MPFVSDGSDNLGERQMKRGTQDDDIRFPTEGVRNLGREDHSNEGVRKRLLHQGAQEITVAADTGFREQVHEENPCRTHSTSPPNPSKSNRTIKRQGDMRRENPSTIASRNTRQRPTTYLSGPTATSPAGHFGRDLAIVNRTSVEIVKKPRTLPEWL